MATVFVVKTGLCVASGIAVVSTFAAGGSLVPAVASLWRGEPAGELVELVLGASAAARPAAKARSNIQLYFFIGGSSFCVRENALSPF